MTKTAIKNSIAHKVSIFVLSILSISLMVGSIGIINSQNKALIAKAAPNDFNWSLTGSGEQANLRTAEITDSKKGVELFGSGYDIWDPNGTEIRMSEVPYLKISSGNTQICRKDLDSISRIAYNSPASYYGSMAIKYYSVNTIGDSVIISGAIGTYKDTAVIDFGNGVTLPNLVPINQPMEGQPYAVGVSFLLKLDSNCNSVSVVSKPIINQTFITRTNSLGTIIIPETREITSPAINTVSNSTSVCVVFETSNFVLDQNDNLTLDNSYNSVECYDESLTLINTFSTTGNRPMFTNFNQRLLFLEGTTNYVRSSVIPNNYVLSEDNVLYIIGNPSQPTSINGTNFNPVSSSNHLIAYDFNTNSVKFTYQDSNISYYIADEDNKKLILEVVNNGSGISTINNTPSGSSCLLIDVINTPNFEKTLNSACTPLNYPIGAVQTLLDLEHQIYYTFDLFSGTISEYSLVDDTLMHVNQYSQLIGFKLADNQEKTMIIFGNTYELLDFGGAGTVDGTVDDGRAYYALYSPTQGRILDCQLPSDPLNPNSPLVKVSPIIEPNYLKTGADQFGFAKLSNGDIITLDSAPRNLYGGGGPTGQSNTNIGIHSLPLSFKITQPADPINSPSTPGTTTNVVLAGYNFRPMDIETRSFNGTDVVYIYALGIDSTNFDGILEVDSDLTGEVLGVLLSYDIATGTITVINDNLPAAGYAKDFADMSIDASGNIYIDDVRVAFTPTNNYSNIPRVTATGTLTTPFAQPATNTYYDIASDDAGNSYSLIGSTDPSVTSKTGVYKIDSTGTVTNPGYSFPVPGDGGDIEVADADNTYNAALTGTNYI